MDYWNDNDCRWWLHGKMNAKKIIIVGGGAFSRELINWVYDLQKSGVAINIIGFLDSSKDALEGFNYNLSWLGDVEDYIPATDEYLLMGIGDPNVKEKLFQSFKKNGAKFYTLIHPRSVVASTAIIGEGVVICPNALISADAIVGDLVAVNGFASVGHDVIVGSYSTLSAHVDLTGWVKVGERVFFGSGARVIPKVRIGSGARIGAGSVVMRHVLENAVIYTNPGKKL